MDALNHCTKTKGEAFTCPHCGKPIAPPPASDAHGSRDNFCHDADLDDPGVDLAASWAAGEIVRPDDTPHLPGRAQS